MKKCFLLLIFIVLLLSGCAGSEGTDSAATEQTLQGCYVEASAVETASGGAVRMYSLPGDNYSELYSVGDQLLLSSGENSQELTLLSGLECAPVAAVTLPVSGGKALYSGYAYFDAENKQVVFLNSQLTEASRLQLPADIIGAPVVSPDGKEVFYCVGQDLYSIIVEQKISRLIKTHSYSNIALMDCYFEGEILSCRGTDGQGNSVVAYISTKTGQTLHTQDSPISLFSYEETYLAMRMDGTVYQRIVGNLAGDARKLNISDSAVAGAVELGGVLGWSVDENNSLILNFYEINTGKKTASQSIAGAGAPKAILADRWSGCLWLLCQDSKTLLRWQVNSSPVADEGVYVSTLFTAKNPDEAGLEACSARAKALNKSHGVSIRLWNNAVKTSGGYTLEAEYQPEAINRVLDELTKVFKEFPSKFLKKTISSKVRICLVRSVNGKTQSVQYWNQDDAYIVLCDGVDIRSEFLKGLGYIIDSHVLGNSSDYDYWYKCNPEGFVYGQASGNEAYLSGDTKAFTDAEAMTSAVEDRARIFWQAMQPDNQKMFQSEAMQAKLKMLCKAIRDAWKLKKETKEFPWEQYLSKSIAYKK